MKLRRFRHRKGRCYELACITQQDNHDWTLVHGVAEGIDHAWLERNGEVYDPVLNRRLPASEYISTFKAVPDKRYSFLEASKMLVETGHSGPWTQI